MMVYVLIYRFRQRIGYFWDENKIMILMKMTPAGFELMIFFRFFTDGFLLI